MVKITRCIQVGPPSGWRISKTVPVSSETLVLVGVETHRVVVGFREQTVPV